MSAVSTPERIEPLSPFVRWSRDERAPIPTATEPEPPSLLIDLLREPRQLVLRLLNADRAPGMVLGSLLAIGLGTSLFTAAVITARGGADLTRGAGLAVLDTLLAVAAALGPIYAVSLLVAARFPMARLVSTMLGATATASLILAALGPLLFIAWRIDPVWAGPLDLVGSLLISAAISGARLHRLMMITAEEVTRSSLGDPDASLAAADRYRVGVLARLSMIILGFTSAIGFWGIDPFFTG